MNDWFKELNELLKVAVSYEFDGASQDSSLPATIRFAVTNSAGPPQPGGRTEIRFDRVSVRVGLPTNMESIEVGMLRPGDSTTVEYQCQVSELPDIEYGVSGDISTQPLFHVETVKGNRLPGDSVNLSPQAYLGMFNDMDVHRWLNSTIREFPLPRPETTLSQLTELGQSLNKNITEIRQSLERLQRFSGFVSRENRQAWEAVNNHLNSVEQYLNDTVRGIGSLRQAVSSPGATQIASAVEHESDRLE